MALISAAFIVGMILGAVIRSIEVKDQLESLQPKRDAKGRFTKAKG